MHAIAFHPLSWGRSAPKAPAYAALRFDLTQSQALTFVAPRTGRLRATEGRIWATCSGSAVAPPDDVVLTVGAPLCLAKGERWVLENWQSGAPAGARFD